MNIPAEMVHQLVKDIEGKHYDTEERLWFRLPENFLDPEYSLLKQYFPETRLEDEKGIYLCGAANVSGKWILGFIDTENFFYPL